MAQEFGTPMNTANPVPPKKSNTGLIIAIIALIVLCCCCVGGGAVYWLWMNGDAILEQYSRVAHLLVV